MDETRLKALKIIATLLFAIALVNTLIMLT